MDQAASGSGDRIRSPDPGALPGPLEPSQTAPTVDNSPNNIPKDSPKDSRAPEPALGESANPVVGLQASTAIDPAAPPQPEDPGTTSSPDLPRAQPPARELQPAPAPAPSSVGLDSIQAPQAQATPGAGGPGDRETAASGISVAIPPETTTAAPATGRPDPPPGPDTQNGSLPQARTAAAPPPERLSPSTSLSGRARDQVAADGSLLKPRPEGPLARLRQRFQP
jgi:hypothetical protein